jgi:hypothetical protein
MADEIVGGLRGIQKELKAVQDEMANLDAGSEHFVKLSQKAGELRDKMKDVKEAVSANAGPALESFGNNLNIAQGQLNSLDLAGFGESMKRMSGNVKGVDFKSFKEGLSSVSSGFSTLGKVILANPLFLIVTVVKTIVSNFDTLVNAGGLVGNVFGFIKDAIGFVIDGLESFSNWIGLTDTKAAERAENEKKRQEEETKLQEEALEKKKREEEKAQAEEKARQEKAASEAKARRDKAIADEKARQEKIKSDQTSLTEFIKQEEEKRYQDTLEAQDKELRQLELTYKAKKDLAHGNTQLLAQLDADYQKSKQAIDEKYLKITADKEIEIAKKNAEILREMKLEQISEEEALAQEIQDIKQGELQTDINNVRDSYHEKIEQAKKYNQDYYVLEEERDKKIKELEDEAAKKREEDLKKQIDEEQKLQNAKYDIAKQYISAAQSLTDAMTTSGLISAKKAFEIGKALSIAQTTISTIQGVQNALNAPQLVGGPIGMALNVANAIAIGAAGAASLAKIASTQYQGAKGGGGNITVPTPNVSGGGSMGGQSPAALNLSALQGNNSVSPLQTYVVAGQVSSAQQAEFKIKNTASILGGG